MGRKGSNNSSDKQSDKFVDSCGEGDYPFCGVYTTGREIYNNRSKHCVSYREFMENNEKPPQQTTSYQ